MLNYNIYSIDGRLIQNGHLNISNNKLDLSSIKSGIYIIEIINNSKLIKN